MYLGKEHSGRRTENIKFLRYEQHESQLEHSEQEERGGYAVREVDRDQGV